MADSHLSVFYTSSRGRSRSWGLSRNESISSDLSNTSTWSRSTHSLVILLISVGPTPPPLSFLLCVIRIFPWLVWLEVYQFYWFPPRASLRLYCFSMIFLCVFAPSIFTLIFIISFLPVFWVSFTFLILVSRDWMWGHWSETSLLFYYTPLVLRQRARALAWCALPTSDTFFLTLIPCSIIPLLISPVACGLLKNMLFCFRLIGDFPEIFPWLISDSIPLCLENMLDHNGQTRGRPQTDGGCEPSSEMGYAPDEIIVE